MKTLIFHGYSDDTFGEYGVTNDDYDNCASGGPIRWLVTAPDEPGGVLVVGQHAPKGVDAAWTITVGAFDPKGDDTPMPAWPMRLQPCPTTPYSPELQIEVPDNFVLACLERQGGED